MPAPILPGQPLPDQPLADQPWDGDGPVFAEPWQAQAFALAVNLHEAGHFTWSEWAQTLGAEIETARVRGDRDLGDTYYQHCLAALERLAAQKGLVSSGDMGVRKSAWKQAYLHTPHGQPVVLEVDAAEA